MSETLVIADYDPAWPERFAVEAKRLKAALGDIALRIDHVGSTSVPGLGAKPIVDIQVSVEVVQPMDSYRERIEGLGYDSKVFPGYEDYPIFFFPSVHPREVHIHVCRTGSEHERRHLAFRDYLRAHPDARREYEALKRELAPRFRADVREQRQQYNTAKTAFIERIQGLALDGYVLPPSG